MNNRRGFTLIEILVVVAIVGILMALLLPALARARKSANLLQDANSLREMHRGQKLYAEDADMGMPVPGKANCGLFDVDNDGAGDYYVPFKGEENIQHNNTRALHSMMIATGYYKPDLCIGSTEASPFVEVHADHQHGLWNPGAQSFWDTNFDCNIMGLANGVSNVSYANQTMTGKRKHRRWERKTVDSSVVQLGSRGTKDGNVHENVVDPSEYTNSVTLAHHGEENTWVGGVVMADNSTKTGSSMTIEGCFHTPSGGHNMMADNQFFAEDNYSNAHSVNDISQGNWTFRDHQGGDSWLTIIRIGFPSAAYPMWD